jgi:DnaJ-class molecular chaperone
MGKHSKKQPCDMCDGTGKITAGTDDKKQEVTCTECDGTGEQN